MAGFGGEREVGDGGHRAVAHTRDETSTAARAAGYLLADDDVRRLRTRRTWSRPRWRKGVPGEEVDRARAGREGADALGAPARP